MKTIKDVNVSYETSKTKGFQGNSRELQKELDKGYKIASGGNGSYVLYMPASAKAHFYVDGEYRVIDVKDEIKTFYNKEKCSQKQVNNINKAFREGKAVLTYDESNGEVTIACC